MHYYYYLLFIFCYKCYKCYTARFYWASRVTKPVTICNASSVRIFALCHASTYANANEPTRTDRTKKPDTIPFDGVRLE